MLTSTTHHLLLTFLACLPLTLASSWGLHPSPLGGSLFQLDTRDLFPRQDDPNDLGTDCGGDPDCTTTDWGCDCGFGDGSWIPDIDKPDQPDQPPDESDEPDNPPPAPEGTLDCYPASSRAGEYKKFSQEKTKEAVHNLCQAFVDDGFKVSEDDDQTPDPTKSPYYDKEYVKGAAEDDSTLVLGPVWATAGCGDAEHKPYDFKEAGIEKCEEYFMRAVDGCPEFDNPNGDEYWKRGGQNKVACVLWSVNAQPL